MFLGCKGHTWAETIEKSNKNYQVQSHEGSTFLKKNDTFWPKSPSWGICPICFLWQIQMQNQRNECQLGKAINLGALFKPITEWLSIVCCTFPPPLWLLIVSDVQRCHHWTPTKSEQLSPHVLLLLIWDFWLCQRWDIYSLLYLVSARLWQYIISASHFLLLKICLVCQYERRKFCCIVCLPDCDNASVNCLWLSFSPT